jgi:putative phosphoribosyl transferase
MERQTPTSYRDRREAGRVLAGLLREYVGCPDGLVLALPRGGVPVAFEVARSLQLPLDLLSVRKLGVPGQEELAFGALAADGSLVLNPEIVEASRLDQRTIEAVVTRETQELRRREALYRAGRPPLSVAGRLVLLVDDGLATGATMRVAVEALRRQSPRAIIVAVPVAPPESCLFLARLATEVSCVCPLQPPSLDAVGAWYQDFSQIHDTEVIDLLSRLPGPTGTIELEGESS